MTSCPEEMGREFGRFWKKIQLSSDPGVEKLCSDPGVEKLCSDHGVEKLESDPGVEKLCSDPGVEKLESDPGVEKLRLDHAGRQLSFCHWGRERIYLPRSPVVGVSTDEAYGWIFRIFTGRDELKSKTLRDVPNVGSIISILWYERLLRIVSLSSCWRTEVKKLIKRSYLNNGVRLFFVFACICICICTVVIDIIMVVSI